MKNFLVLLLFFGLDQFGRAGDEKLPPLRPPAVPLVAHDPYFSIWSPADRLTDADTIHWTGKPHRLSCMVRIDGKAFRLMGKEPAKVPALPQTNLEVLPARTIYTFEGEGLRLKLTFMTPALPDDLMIYSRPVTYLTWELSNVRPGERRVDVVFGASAEIAVKEPSQMAACFAEATANFVTIKIGSTDQPVLARPGDKLCIDWGYFYLAAPKSQVPSAAVVPSKSFWRGSFLKEVARTNLENVTPRPAPAENFVASMVLDFGKLGGKPVSRWLMIAYDDEYSIQYFKKNLRPYWRRNGDDAAVLLKKAAADYESLKQRCERFDTELMTDLTKAGGAKYAQLCALASRQCLAGNKLVADRNGQPLLFPKENSSSGMISTVDVIYPMSPQFLLFSPSLAKAMLVPILDYASSTRWPWAYAPHDLGGYPIAKGPAYGGGEEKGQPMRVEETGNMLIMLAALAHVEGNAVFCEKYWPLLGKWADYLKTNGFDPDDQLCTDDFTGSLAHNANLSVKAICGLGAFARLCELRGDPVLRDEAVEYSKLAEESAARWLKEADDGDHYRLAFNQPGTWSQKYNLVWDRILGLNLFPDSVRAKEMIFYRTKLNDFGLPLDNRETYTKVDWSLWTATLTQNRVDFDALLNPVCRFLNQTTNRVPISDWVWTQAPVTRGFQARPVVGAFFLQMLYDRATWKKWASRDTNQPSNWAAILKPPKIVTVVPTAEKEPIQWRYTTQTPADGWNKANFNDVAWSEGPAPFGLKGAAAATVRTDWNTSDIWLRREITMPAGNWTDLSFRLYLSAGVQIYLNGILAATFPGYAVDYQQVRVKGKARLAVKPGKNVIAVHAARTALPQCIDVGIVDLRDADE